MRHPLRARGLVTLLIVVSTLVAGPAADAMESRSPEAQRAEVRAQRRQAAAAVDILQADTRELSAVMRQQADQALATREVADLATAAADQAAVELLAARDAEARAQAEHALLRQRLKRLAVDAYIRPSSQSIVPVPNASVLEVARRRRLLDAVVERAATVAEDLQANEDDLEVRRFNAEQAQSAANAERARATEELAKAEQALAAHQAVLSEVEARIEAALAESDALAQIDQKLSAEISAREAELARQAALNRQRVAARTGGLVTPGARPGPAPSGPLQLVRVEGIVVAASIGQNVARLLAQARADGFELGGGGFRDSEAQINVRRRNCGTSDYDVWEKPASQCSPPSARPGTSMHERGLAVDFTWQGSIINSRSSPAFQWLAANAASYGLYNLPSEPWHWSTNGR